MVRLLAINPNKQGEEHLEDVQWEPAVSVFGTIFGKSIPGQYRMYRGRQTRRITCQASQQLVGPNRD